MADKRPPKTRMISMRITEKQYQALTELSERIKRQTGFRITRASLIMKLMENGFPALEREFPRERHRDDEDDRKHSA